MKKISMGVARARVPSAVVAVTLFFAIVLALTQSGMAAYGPGGSGAGAGAGGGMMSGGSGGEGGGGSEPHGGGSDGTAEPGDDGESDQDQEGDDEEKRGTPPATPPRGGGGEDGEETAGNNLSFPVVAADGFAIPLVSEFSWEKIYEGPYTGLSVEERLLLEGHSWYA